MDALASKAFFFMIVFMLLPLVLMSECTCDRKEDVGSGAKQRTLGYKLAAIGSILVAGTLGVCLPILGKAIPSLRPEKDVFLILKTFAAGVILATGFVHVLPDAFDNLTSPCLPESPWGDFPFTGLVAMVAAIAALMIDTCATAYYQRAGSGGTNKEGAIADVGEEHECHVHVHTRATHDHLHGSGGGDTHELLRNRVISQVLELGIVAHSIIMGIALGASQSLETIRPLVAALSFHQFFEGIGLGGCISQARFKRRVVALMSLFFSVTTPAGIAIGIGISNIYDENGKTALIVEGVFNAASAGILIYMALVDLLAADFLSSRMRTNFRLQLGCNFALLVGVAAMSLLAKWA